VREPLADCGELALALGERPAADAAHPHALHVADAVANLGEQLLDVVLLPCHGASFHGLHEYEVSCT